MRITASFEGPVDRQKTLPDSGVERSPLEVHALLALDREVACVRGLELLFGHADESVVDIHKLRHETLLSLMWSGSRGAGRPDIGRATYVAYGRPILRLTS